jgi:hypothetical protein
MGHASLGPASLGPASLGPASLGRRDALLRWCACCRCTSRRPAQRCISRDPPVIIVSSEHERTIRNEKVVHATNTAGARCEGSRACESRVRTPRTRAARTRTPRIREEFEHQGHEDVRRCGVQHMAHEAAVLYDFELPHTNQLTSDEDVLPPP